MAAAYVLYHHYYRTLALDRLVQLSLYDMLVTLMHVFDSDKRVPEPIRRHIDKSEEALQGAFLIVDPDVYEEPH